MRSVSSCIGVLIFDYKRLSRAIATRDRSYQLLLWISDAIGRNLIEPSRAARHSGGPQAAVDWLRHNYGRIPEKLRPAKEDIDEFAAFFSTYLTSSFDVVEEPGMKGEGPIARHACRCELCVRIVNAPHLRAKKLLARDKKRAILLMEESVIDLARAHGVEVDERMAAQLVADESTRRPAAYAAYGHWLIKRLEGESDGPAVLALWRLIAWDPRGGRRPGYKLKLDDFKVAEKMILSAIRDAF